MEGDLYMWGRNLENQCGNGSAADLFLPEKVAPHFSFSCNSL